MLRFFIFFLIISFNTILSQNIKEKDSLQILDVLETQRIAWNNNDINEFMQGYLKSDKLVFSGSNGPVYGWNYVKERYLKTYSSKELMGYLDFDINDLFLISKRVALLLGKFNITRDNENLSGYFTLVFKKIKGNWYIVSDHTS